MTQYIRDEVGTWEEHYATERERMPYFQARLAIVLSMLAGEKGRILDIGCAAGAKISKMRAMGFSVVGFDLAEEMVAVARRRFIADREVQHCRANVERIPFRAQSFDHVVCLGVLEFVSDYRVSLQEVHRVMRSGGLAVFAIPSRISLYNSTVRLVDVTARPLWRAAKRVLSRDPAAGQVETPITRNLCVPWRYRSLLRENGFRPERSAYSNFFIYPIGRLFPNLELPITAALEPLCSVPLLRCAASVYLVSARKE